MTGIFSVKRLSLDLGGAQHPTGLAICVENAFRPRNVDKDKIEQALCDLFRGATGVVPSTGTPAGYSSNGSRVVAWGEIEGLELESTEDRLIAGVDGLNAIYSYQRR